jgi:hypothetical protein
VVLSLVSEDYLEVSEVGIYPQVHAILQIPAHPQVPVDLQVSGPSEVPTNPQVSDPLEVIPSVSSKAKQAAHLWKCRKIQPPQMLKRLKMKAGQIYWAISNVVNAPIELKTLQAPKKAACKARIYNLNELEAYRVNIIPWDRW